MKNVKSQMENAPIRSLTLPVLTLLRDIIRPIPMSDTKMVQSAGVEVREVSSIEEYDTCIKLQREAFGLPDLEISPRRHLIVSRMAGGWTLGANIREYAVNFYGTDYGANPAEKTIGMDSDRLFAGWELRSPRVEALSEGRQYPLGAPDEVIEIPGDFLTILKSDAQLAKREQLRVREEFLKALSGGLVCRAFERNAARPRYLLFRDSTQSIGRTL